MPDMKGETVYNLIHMNTTSTEQAAWFRTMKHKKQKKTKTKTCICDLVKLRSKKFNSGSAAGTGEHNG